LKIANCTQESAQFRRGTVYEHPDSKYGEE
jgi:hypothetical protein